MIISYSTIALWSVGLIACCYISLLLRERIKHASRLPLPPGPRGHPIIGNILDFPTYKSWEAFDEWFKIYGDMVFCKIFGQPFLILGSAERAHDLFEKRSSNYSDRPHCPMFDEIMDYTWNMVFLRYGLEWRGHRRFFHEHFNPSIIHKYNSAQITTTRALLRLLFKSPDDFALHIRHAFASTIFKLTYGMDILKDENSSLIKIAETVAAAFAEAGNAGAFLVDSFPWMKYIPAWLPGAGWKRKAQYWRKAGECYVHGPWNRVKEQLREGTAQPSIAADLIEKLSNQTSLSEERMARNACATAVFAGSDTMTSTIQSFFMAMVLYPQVQKKAQEELDGVVGDRFPEFNDKLNLPYINAMVKELLRWQLVTPLAVPHMATEADEYNGYYIPKGTIVIGNSWSITHDPKAYKEPFSYNPDRFLKDGKIDPTVQDPTGVTFGYGRRICSGRFFAQDFLFILISHILTVYDIRPGLDDDGKELEIEPRMTNEMLSYPVPFPCRITPRSENAQRLIQDSSFID